MNSATRLSAPEQPHPPYFAALNDMLRQHGGGIAQLIIDLDRLDQNITHLSAHLGSGLPLRLVAKSLPPRALLQYVSKSLNCQRFMAFHQPHLNQLARDFPRSDILLGKPLPLAAARQFYQQLEVPTEFVPAQQLTWLIDSLPRLYEYAELAQALEQPMQIAFEIDIGLTRGGLNTPEQLTAALTWLQTNPNRLSLRGLMGYDAHIAQAPFWLGRRQAFRNSSARYKAFIEAAQRFPLQWPQQPTLNGAGSLTYRLHTYAKTVLNEVSVGSALLKPSDFDNDLLSELQPALWIASPVLKALPGQLPFIGKTHALLEVFNRNRQQTYYLYGGQWPAQPHSPNGLRYDDLFGRSANQERLIGSRRCGLQVDDWVFFRPQRSEGLFELFNQIQLVRNGQWVDHWDTIPKT